MQYIDLKVYIVHKKTTLCERTVENFTEFKLFLILSANRSVVDTATTIRAGRYGFRNPAAAKALSLLRHVQTGSKAHPDSSSMGTGVTSRE
jgi:hypothetical protein